MAVCQCQHAPRCSCHPRRRTPRKDIHHDEPEACELEAYAEITNSIVPLVRPPRNRRSAPVLSRVLPTPGRFAGRIEPHLVAIERSVEAIRHWLPTGRWNGRERQ